MSAKYKCKFSEGWVSDERFKVAFKNLKVTHMMLSVNFLRKQFQ